MAILVPVTFLLYLSALCIGVNGGGVSGLSDQASFSVEGAEHLPYNIELGYQVILPGLKFHCYGKIIDWSALMVYEPPTTSLAHGIVFQVWRPNGTGKYVRVGYDSITVFRPIPLPNHTADDGLMYHNLTKATEDIEGGNSNSQDDQPLYFQPGDVVGFYIDEFSNNIPLYITYHHSTDSDPPDLVMDMFVTTTTNSLQLCTMNECSQNVSRVKSVIPNIHFTYMELSEDHEAFQQQSLPTEACEMPVVDVEECPTTSALLHPTSPLSSPTTSSLSPSLSSMPTMPVTPPDDRTLLLVIIIIAAGVVVILVAGGVFVIIVTVVIKRRNMGKNGCTTPTEVRNALYCELNDVDVSTASTVVKPHTYRELERHTGPIPPPPHFALSTGSAMSLSSHQGRPLPPNTSVSGPVQGGAASIQRILDPGAHSMHILRTSAPFAQGREICGGSLHGTRVGANYRPPIPPGMQPQHSENGRRGSVPLKIWRQSHQQQHQILLPGKSMPVLSSTPVPSPPTPQMTDPPVPYLTPERPWYNSDYELTNNPVKTLPEEEGLYVPTMEERKSLGNKIEDYSRLRHPRHSLHCNGDVVFFDEPDVFEEPASSTSEIYQQLSSRKFREIIRHYITIQDHVGSGHFALVHRGIWRTPQGEREVAVKELKKSAEEENRVKFLQEAVIMGQFNHNNVVKLYGVVTIDEPLMIVMELMPNGDLKNYLDQFSVRRSSQRHSTSCTPPPSPVAIPPSLPAQLLSFCRQIADGMDYLSSKNFVHRDLAARNVFLTRDFACKIGDFGLARDLGEEDVYLSRGGKVPIKWTAPEALQYREYTSASDVWSYGIVLFEIWSLGHRPFDACTLENDVRKVMEGSVCQPPPPGCPRALYQLMVHCWHYDPTNRPSFSSVCEYLNSSDSDLLKLPRELPPSVSPQATQLGAPLSEAKGLYSDLQYCYDESIV